MVRVIPNLAVTNTIYVVNMIKKIFLFFMLVLLISSVSATTVPKDKLKEVLVYSLQNYFENPSSSALNADEIKDLLDVYFTSRGEKVDLSNRGRNSGFIVEYIYIEAVSPKRPVVEERYIEAVTSEQNNGVVSSGNCVFPITFPCTIPLKDIVDCTPQCSNNFCGSDGCGGTCSCNPGYTCTSSEQCEIVSTGGDIDLEIPTMPRGRAPSLTMISRCSSRTFDYKIKNQGNSASGDFKIGIYLSKDDKVLSNDDTFLSTVSVNGINANTEVSKVTTITHPCNIMVHATYYTIFVIDHDNQISETNENNNLITSPGFVKS